MWFPANQKHLLEKLVTSLVQLGNFKIAINAWIWQKLDTVRENIKPVVLGRLQKISIIYAYGISIPMALAYACRISFIGGPFNFHNRKADVNNG